ncbi:MAG TPA: type I methionyl aminopeptidase [Phototrophicaceae bacterium]|nr:type I methionyl aminopeptidase [Phototrophicaceae bacterium]
MSIESEKDITGLLRIGRIVGMAIQAMRDALEPGMTTADLDAVGERFLKQNGARSAPQLAYKFPGVTCISVNDEVAHGIPGQRVIQAGDIVNIDVSAELNGYIADSGFTVAVPPVAPETQRLLGCAQQALNSGLEVAKAGNHLNAIGRAVQNEAARCGYNVIRELSGHGVGRKIHESPSVPNYFTNRAKERLTEGLVITLEPFLTPGSGHIYTADDGWTIKTVDHQRFAQFEHTIIVTKDKPILVTAV